MYRLPFVIITIYSVYLFIYVINCNFVRIIHSEGVWCILCDFKECDCKKCDSKELKSRKNDFVIFGILEKVLIKILRK